LHDFRSLIKEDLIEKILDFGFRSWITIAKSESGSKILIQKSDHKIDMAERVGFEPTVQFPVHSISSAASSATPAPLPLKED
jgi:hypothetical protein